MVLRRFSLFLLFASLVVLTGLAGAAHAVSNGVTGPHCENHLFSAGQLSPASSEGEMPTFSGHHHPDRSGAVDCSSICQAVALPFQHCEAAQDQRAIVQDPQVTIQTNLNEPDSLYRPPDV